MRRHVIRPRFYVFLCLLIVIFFGVGLLISGARLRNERAYLRTAVERRDQAAAEMSSLRSELEYAHTDEYVERSARDRLGMMYPGEYRYVTN